MIENDSKSDEKEEEMSFSDLLDESYKAPVKLKPGDKTSAIIFKITDEWIFLDLGGKSEGCLARSELADENNEIAVSGGDSLEVFFLSEANGEMVFTTKIGKGSADKSQLEEAYRNRIPVEGSVEKEIKGGFSIKLSGSVQAFCPYSQMGLRRVENAEQYVGQLLSFMITEFSEKGRNIVLSNRAVLAEEQEKKKELLKETLKEGSTINGTVVSIRAFGAFIDIDGADGLIPISEIGWGRVENAEQYVGQLLSFMITEFGEKGRNIVLSNRAVLAEEQEKKKELLKGTLKEGSTINGTVTSIRAFGAFIDIDGAEGLIPISEIGWGRVENINDYLYVGQEVEVEIMKLDWENNKLSFSLKAKQPDPWESSGFKYSDGSIHPGIVSRLAKFGAFITLEPGIDGLLHISRIGGGKRINHPGDVLKAGQEIGVKVEKLDLENKKISLIMDGDEAVLEEKENFVADKDMKGVSGINGKSAESFGTLGDLLKSKLNKKNK